MDPRLSVSHRAITQEMFVLVEEAFSLDLVGRSTQVQGLRAPKAVCDSDSRQRENPKFPFKMFECWWLPELRKRSPKEVTTLTCPLHLPRPHVTQNCIFLPKASFFYKVPCSVEWLWAITFAVFGDASLWLCFSVHWTGSFLQENKLFCTEAGIGWVLTKRFFPPDSVFAKDPSQFIAK